MTLTRFSTLVAAAVLAPTVVASASTVRFETTLGDVDIDLFDDVAPLTVAQFTGIVERGDFDGTVFHRSDPGFVVQGGGFVVTGDPSVDGGDAFSPAPEVDPVQNEPGVSNTRGTIALARVGGLPDSGTNQFFFNLADSNSFLDDIDGGFTVFGELADDESQAVIDAIAALTVFQTDPGLPSAFNEVPATGTAPGSDLPGADQLVLITTATVIPDDVVAVDPVARRRSDRPRGSDRPDHPRRSDRSRGPGRSGRRRNPRRGALAFGPGRRPAGAGRDGRPPPPARVNEGSQRDPGLKRLPLGSRFFWFREGYSRPRGRVTETGSEAPGRG